MKVLIACEFSGTVRDAFLARGHDAISCDLLPTESPGPHYQGDVMDIINDGFDLMIAHPPCTYLTNAANKWLYVDSGACTALDRLDRREDAIEFFKALQAAPIEKIAIENPQPHPYVMEKVGRFADKVQPWMFGDPETKGVCLWLKNLPPLMSTSIESKREDIKHRLPPGPDRAKLRSMFFPKMAQAMAEQWR
jgi:hypothetical protein